MRLMVVGLKYGLVYRIYQIRIELLILSKKEKLIFD